MAGNVTTEFRVRTAKQFKDGISNDLESLYFFYGRTTPDWPNNVPPLPLRTPLEETYEPWRDMIGLKRVVGTDITRAIRRNDWISGTVYPEWRHDNLIQGQFGVPRLTEFFVSFNRNGSFPAEDHIQVFKCIFNNGGAVSTIVPIKPAGDITKQFTTADGYIWKFMYEVSNDEAKKWLISGYIPVRDRILTDPNKPNTVEQDQWDIQNSVSGGEITHVEVISSGQNYRSSAGVANTKIGGSSSGTLLVVNNSISTIGTTDNFFNNAAIKLLSGPSTGEVRTITTYLTSGLLFVDAAVKVLDGDDYEIGAKINFLAPDGGSGAVAYGTANATGNITGITIHSSGTGYYSGVTLIPEGVFISGTNGSGGTANVYVGPIGGHGHDPAVELDARYTIIRSQLINTEGGVFEASNDYEQIGLVSKPLLANTGLVASGSVYKQATDIVLATTTVFSEDQLLLGETSNATGVVLSTSGTDLSLINVTGAFDGSETIQVSGTSTINAVISSITSTEDLKKHSGSIVYVENISKITRNPVQTEDYKMIFQF